MVPDYVSYPKRFLPYRWFKPLLTILLASAFWGTFQIASILLLSYASVFSQILTGNRLSTSELLWRSGESDNLYFSVPGAIMTFGSVATAIVAVLIANRIINARPFSSYSSSRGGFSFTVFLKSFGAAIILFALPLVLISLFTEPKTGNIKFTVASFLVLTVLCPLQCAGEEYFFRGLLMQSFGSWIKFPIFPILIQAIIFGLMHIQYNVIGMITILISGIILGLCAFFTKGLEASCALHIANNLVSFYLVGFGIGAIESDVTILSMVITGGFQLLYLAFIIFATKKLGWFSKIKKDDVAVFNAKIEARRAQNTEVQPTNN